MFKAIGDKYLFDIEEFKNDNNINITFNNKEKANSFINYVESKGIDKCEDDLYFHDLNNVKIIMYFGEDSRLLRINYKKQHYMHTITKMRFLQIIRFQLNITPLRNATLYILMIIRKKLSLLKSISNLKKIKKEMNAHQLNS